MDELGSIWRFQEGMDELKQRLLYTNLELESVRTMASDEIKRSKENEMSLLNLLNVAYKERDEARESLQKLLIKLSPSSPIPLVHNSSITESNSQSHNSSPVSSFFDPVTSPDFSNINVSDSDNNVGSFVENYDNVYVPARSDPFEGLVKGKVLPQKGKLLEAVMDAGPLLANLLVAGPLPRWRNPPPLKTFKIPPVSINGAAQNRNGFDSSSHIDLSCGTSQLNFRTGPCLNNGRLLSNAANMVPFPKRQRFF